MLPGAILRSRQRKEVGKGMQVAFGQIKAAHFNTHDQRFGVDALEAVPAMAISAIAIKRESVSSDRLEMRLEINLYLNK